MALMVFCMLAIVRLARLAAWLRRLALLAATGRMRLARRLMQAAIHVTLFRGWVLGPWAAWGRVGPAAGMLPALFMFWAVLASRRLWWLRRRERGPLWALRARLTCGPQRAAVQFKAPPQ